MKHFLMCLLHFGTPKLPFGRPLGSLGVSFSACWRGLWSFLGILWVQNVARDIKMRVINVILAQVEVARGSQRLSGFDFETIFITSWVLFGIFVCFLVRKALCMQFGTLTWTLAVFSLT